MFLKSLLRGWDQKGAKRVRQAEWWQTVPVHNVWQGLLDKEFVRCSQRHRGSGRPQDLLNYVVKNEVAAFDEGSTPGTLPSNSQENLNPGLVFPSFERMQAAIKEWSDANFSPLTMGPRNITNVKKSLHSFHCPNALVKTIKKSAGWWLLLSLDRQIGKYA